MPRRARSISTRSWSRPSPVADENPTIGDPSSEVPAARIPDLFLDLRDSSRCDQINLRDHEDRVADAEEVKDVEMLDRLRHDPVIGGDGEEHEIDAVGARQHVADESLVPGNVDDARARAVWEIEVREPKVDGDASLLLFLEPVRVLSGERFDEARLAVVDVAGGADDEWHQIYAGRAAASTGCVQRGTRSSGSKIVRASRMNRSALTRPTIEGRAWRNFSAM